MSSELVRKFRASMDIGLLFVTCSRSICRSMFLFLTMPLVWSLAKSRHRIWRSIGFVFLSWPNIFRLLPLSKFWCIESKPSFRRILKCSVQRWFFIDCATINLPNNTFTHGAQFSSDSLRFRSTSVALFFLYESYSVSDGKARACQKDFKHSRNRR